MKKILLLLSLAAILAIQCKKEEPKKREKDQTEKNNNKKLERLKTPKELFVEKVLSDFLKKTYPNDQVKTHKQLKEENNNSFKGIVTYDVPFAFTRKGNDGEVTVCVMIENEKATHKVLEIRNNKETFFNKKGEMIDKTQDNTDDYKKAQMILNSYLTFFSIIERINNVKVAQPNDFLKTNSGSYPFVTINPKSKLEGDKFKIIDGKDFFYIYKDKGARQGNQFDISAYYFNNNDLLCLIYFSQNSIFVYDKYNIQRLEITKPGTNEQAIYEVWRDYDEDNKLTVDNAQKIADVKKALELYEKARTFFNKIPNEKKK